MSDHRKSPSMQSEDFILAEEMKSGPLCSPFIFIPVFLPFNLSNQIKDVKTLLFDNSRGLSNGKDHILQIMYLFIEEKTGQLCLLPSHPVAVFLFFFIC